MLSYHNDESLKAKIVAEMKKHQEQDQFIKQAYGVTRDGKFQGCAVGCAIDSMNKVLGKSYDNSNHRVFEEALGIPEWLANLQDKFFESLPEGEDSQFAVDFLEVIPVGVDLNPVKHKFLAFLLKNVIETVEALKDINDDLKTQVLNVVKGSLSLHESAILTGKWDEEAARAAEAAAWAAWGAWSAAWSTWSPWSARDATNAAWAAAREAARDAAWSAREAAWSAWEAARYAACAARDATDAAWSARDSDADLSEKIKIYAEKLIELLKETKGENNG